MYKNKKQYYHALDIACIESLECDIPLDMGFNILRYLGEPEFRYYTLHLRFKRRVASIISQSRSKVRKTGKGYRPYYLKSNAGAGYR